MGESPLGHYRDGRGGLVSVLETVVRCKENSAFPADSPSLARHLHGSP